MDPYCPDCAGAVTRVDAERDRIPTFRCQETDCRALTTDPNWEVGPFDEESSTGMLDGGVAISYSGSHAGILDDGRDSQFVNGNGETLVCARCGSLALPTSLTSTTARDSPPPIL
jgi:hypothetical protein